MNARDSLKNRGDGSREKVPDILQSRVMTGKKAPEKFRKLPDSIDSPPPSPPRPDASPTQARPSRKHVFAVPASGRRLLRLALSAFLRPCSLCLFPLRQPPGHAPHLFPLLLLFSVPHVARDSRPLRSLPPRPDASSDASPPLSQTTLRRSRVRPTPSPSRTLLPLRASSPALPTRHSLFPPGGFHSSSRRFPAGQ